MTPAADPPAEISGAPPLWSIAGMATACPVTGSATWSLANLPDGGFSALDFSDAINSSWVGAI